MMRNVNTIELYRLSREQILDRYLVHNQIRFFFRAFIPWKIETSMKGLGPRIHESWKRHAQELGLSNLRMARFDAVLDMIGDLIRDELRTPPADARPELWRRWVDDLVWRLPYVEHAVNAHFLWALAVLSPERLALLWSTALQVNAGNSLWPHGEGGIPHEMQVDGLLFGPDVGVCLEMKVRGVGRGPSKLTAKQLGKYEGLGERLRTGASVCTGKQLHLAILLPESAASAATTGEFMEALASSAAPVRFTDAASRGVGRGPTATSHSRPPSAQPSAFDSIHVLTFGDFVSAASVLLDGECAGTASDRLAMLSVRDELVRLAARADGPRCEEALAHSRPSA